MPESPPIIIRSRRSKDTLKDFSYTPAMVRIPASSDYIKAYRLNAWESFVKQSFPSTKNEAWRRTDIRQLRPQDLRLATEIDTHKSGIPENMVQKIGGEQYAGQVVLTPGSSETNLKAEMQAKGVVFTDLKTAEEEHSHLLEKVMGKIVEPAASKFAAMAASLSSTGAFLYVPKGVHISQPLYSLYWGPGLDISHISHILVYLEEGSSATYIHEFGSPSEEGGKSLHAGIIEGYVGPSARLSFVELQSWGEHIWNFNHQRFQVDRDGHLDWVISSVGSYLTKSFTDLDLISRGSSGKISGFYLSHNKQHLDIDTQQNHLAAYTTSDLLFKGALLDESRVVWQGMIYVAPGANQIDGYQTNKNLILSNDARADSIPGLEILTDDVRCSHGATVGNIEQEQLFYLLSRGIPQDEAERLIIEGFFHSIMQRIPIEDIRERLALIIHDRASTSI